MVFSTVSLQVISTHACLCYAEKCMAILKKKCMNKQPLLILTLDPKLALPSFVHGQYCVCTTTCNY